VAVSHRPESDSGCPLQLAIYSPADRLMPHRFKADESYMVGGANMTPVQCYLDVEGIVKLAKEQGVDAIHPGYGFLSENSTFARRCTEEGIVFIGPTPETIEARSMYPRYR
jgi:pyruvate carboxylase